MTTPKWKSFEELAESIQKQFVGEDATVTRNDRLRGRLSGNLREIDISIRQKIGTYDILVAIDCKDYKKAVDVKKVEEFIGLVKDVGANKAAIISAKGFSAAAKRRAQNAGIDLYTLADTEKHMWQTPASIPAVVLAWEMGAYQLRFTGTGPFAVPTDPDFRVIPILCGDGGLIGLAQNLLLERWTSGEVPRSVGRHEVELVSEQAFIRANRHLYPVNVVATVSVRVKRLSGQLPLAKIQGFRDEIAGGVMTKGFTTSVIDLREITTNWKEVSTEEALAIRPVIELHIDTVPARLKADGTPEVEEENPKP